MKNSQPRPKNKFRSVFKQVSPWSWGMLILIAIGIVGYFSYLKIWPTIVRYAGTYDIVNSTSPIDGAEMVFVPAGEFEMGINYPPFTDIYLFNQDADPAHDVYLDAFWIDQTEVTNRMYIMCEEAGACTPPEDTDNYRNNAYADHPIANVEWKQANTYCLWAGRRLPTEAEWEKAARGTDGRSYPWGEGINADLANYDTNIGETTPVGSYPEGMSPYGALDMIGNVSEWLADWYDKDYYHNSPQKNPVGPASSNLRVRRGGGFSFILSGGIGSAVRDACVVGCDYEFLGFRCAVSP